ncbi:RIO kinase 1 [Virgisporangium aliadipatigenens]|uniref:non-specific serine/threonine protein kinase n=1 Tax=Virgisporangium aliadipatigenens TaxID=741659 RepID=A0A8J3YNP9_9ACTN|nr:RIO1 family regulatory kinase/ATPase [Virgisporangium aliadipatigenens]GIJ47463.1 RIO kinase 1 [Virgisporangium aliadipatigenens]
MREQDFGGPSRGRRRRFDDEETYVSADDEETFVRRRQPVRLVDDRPELDGPPFGDRWSTWVDTDVLHGPEPWPAWVITDDGAIDTDLGVLKTGKEADVSLLERVVPDTDRGVLLAAKRYRSTEHRLFHRDAGYLEGRRVRESRTNRAMGSRTAFGRQVIAAQWAAAEFAALANLWELGQATGGLRVPYPVQLDGTELLLEFLGDADGQGAPRLVQTRPSRDELADLWQQTVDAVTVLARAGLAHGDLSPYNVLVHEGQLVLIDLPQVVDVVINPQGPEFLARDVRVMADWFTAKGHPVDAPALTEDLLRDAGIR